MTFKFTTYYLLIDGTNKKLVCTLMVKISVRSCNVGLTKIKICFFPFQLLMDPLVLSVLYVWCQVNKDTIVQFWFGMQFKVGLPLSL